MVSQGIQVLSPGFGYGIVVGIGAFFALLMMGLTYLQNRYTIYSTKSSEEFNTASRSVKPGLIAAGIVSSWTWSATLLTSSTFAYTYGIDGPMWYATLGTAQILVFSLIGIKIKTKAPGAHTFPEVVQASHGTFAHITYLWNGFATNLLVGACLNLGGSQVVAALTGMNVYAACFMIPLVVAAYVIVGGLRSTFIADYTHTAILFLTIIIFCFTMYATSDIVGGIDGFYDLLVEAGKRAPIEGNAGNGSYLTFFSPDGLVFAANLAVSGMSVVWCDQAYWQRAIASRPETSVKAYILGGIAWYGIPFGFATCMGLGAAALTTSPRFPTYPNPLSAAENGAGLSSPATAITLLGSGGAGLMLLLLFMAVTSSTSAELIAASSLITFDIYKTYIKPKATSESLVFVSHVGIIIYSLALAVFCSILNRVNVNLTWLLTVLGIMVGGAAVPVGLVLMWGRMSTIATVATPYLALTLGLMAWLVTTSKRSGGISIETSGEPLNALAGNLVSACMGAVIAVILSFLFPGKVGGTKASELGVITGVPVEGSPSESGSASPKMTEKDEEAGVKPSPTTLPEEPSVKKEPQAVTRKTGNEIVDMIEATNREPLDPAVVKKAERLAVTMNWAFLTIAVFLVPFTLFGTKWVFNKPFFRGWVVMSFIWVWTSMVICVIYPIVESRNALSEISRGVMGDIKGLWVKKTATSS